MPVPNMTGLVKHNPTDAGGPRIQAMSHNAGEKRFCCPVCKVHVEKFISLFVGQWFGRMCYDCASRMTFVVAELLDGLNVTTVANEEEV